MLNVTVGMMFACSGMSPMQYGETMVAKLLRIHKRDVRNEHTMRPARVSTHRAGKLVTMVAVVMSIILPPGLARAAVGDLDNTFDTDGKLSTDFFGGPEAAFDVVVQPDGRIIVAGAARTASTGADFALARYNSDGSLDTSFGAEGKVAIDFSGSFDQANALALQPDGKIVLAGITGDQMVESDFALARFNSDGGLDTSFGTDGKVVTDLFGGLDSAAGVALQPDGRIVVIGASFNSALGGDFALARYNGDGSLDTSFGTDGKVTTDFFGLSDAANAIALLPNGRIVVAGSALSSGAAPDFGVARYNSEGSLDLSFGTGGKVTTNFFGFSDIATGLVAQADGRIVVAGAANNLNVTGLDFALARYTESGTLDESFGNGGRVTTHFLGNLDAASDVGLQPGGRIVVAGTTTNADGSTGDDFALARYDTDGQLDSSFGTAGKVTTDFFGGHDSASALAVQADDRIVVTGLAANGITDNDFAVARYTAPTVPDFSITLEPESAAVTRGRKIKIKVSVDRVLGFAGGVTVTPQGADDLNIVLNQESVLIEGAAVKFKLKVKMSAPIGRHQVVFVGQDAEGRQRSATLTLEIQ